MFGTGSSLSFFSVSPLCPSLLSRHVLFGFSPDELCCVPRFFVYVINVCKFVIWVACNDFCFPDKRPSAVSVIECQVLCSFSFAPVFSSFSVLSSSSLFY